jgi:hypothetical protein
MFAIGPHAADLPFVGVMKIQDHAKTCLSAAAVDR